MVWIQIRTNILSILIWVQTVCKGYQQMIIVATSFRVSYNLDQDQDQHSVHPDLGPNCLKGRLSAENKKSLLARKELKGLSIFLSPPTPSFIQNINLDISTVNFLCFQLNTLDTQSELGVNRHSRSCLCQFRGIPWNQTWDVHRGLTLIIRC